MAQMTGKALDDAIRQKALAGKGVTDSANQAAYDKYRAEYEAEIARKAATGTALTGNSKGVISAGNQSIYDGLVAAQNAPREKISAGGPTGEVTTSSVGGGGVVTGGNTGADYANRYTDFLKEQGIADLRKAYDSNMSRLGAEKSAIQPRFYDARNSAAAGSQQSAKNLAEFMAARGSTSSGVAAQGEITRNMNLQGNLGALKRQETEAFTDIERRTTDLGSAFENDKVSVSAGAEAARMQALMNDFYAQRDFNLQESNVTGNYNGQQTRSAMESDRTYNWNTDPNNPNNAGQILSNQLAKLQLENYPESVKQQAKLYEQQYKSGEISLEVAEYQAKELMDPNSVTNKLNNYAVEASRLGNEELRKRIDQIGKMPVVTEHEREMKKVSLEKAKLELDALKNPTTPAASSGDINRYINQISDLYTRYDSNTGQRVVTNPQGIETYIHSLGLSPEGMAQLYDYYGLEY